MEHRNCESLRGEHPRRSAIHKPLEGRRTSRRPSEAWGADTPASSIIVDRVSTQIFIFPRHATRVAQDVPFGVPVRQATPRAPGGRMKPLRAGIAAAAH